MYVCVCVCVFCVCCYVLTLLICVVYAFAPDVHVIVEAWCIAQRHGLMKLCQVAKTSSAEIAGLLVSLKDCIALSVTHSRCVLASDVF